MTEKMMERGYQNFRNFDRLSAFNKLLTQTDFTWVALGTSMTFGHECQDSVHDLQGPDCAWPNRFNMWLKSMFPNKSIEMINPSVPGATVCSLSENIALFHMITYEVKHVDLVIVDVVVEDQNGVD